MAIIKLSKKVAGRYTPTYYNQYTLTGEGYLFATTGLDITPVNVAGVIVLVKVMREIAGTSGSTIIDINKNGTTIFTTQGNRPTFAYGSGNNLVVTAAPEIIELSENDLLSFDIDQIEGGSPANIRIEIIME